MKSRAWCVALLVALVACNVQSVNVQPVMMGRLEVYVYWENQPQANKRVELLEPKDVRFTAASGIAEFVLPEGKYTVRAFDINRGGPGMRVIEQFVTIKAGETTRVDVLDCLPCV